MERQITPNLMVADVLARWPEVIPVFIHHRLACVGCSMAPFETLGDAMRIYGLEAEPFLTQLEHAIQSCIPEQEER